MSEQVNKPLLLSIVGPTAVGKTSLTIQLAKVFGTEIISADSRQFYQELEIGTAKPSTSELQEARHHFIDSHSIAELYSAGAFGRDAQEMLKDLFTKYPLVIAVGGSSLYLKALWEGFDEIPDVDPQLRVQLNKELKQEGLDKLLAELHESDPDYYEAVDQKNGQRIVRALEVIRGTGEKFSTFRKSREQELFYRNVKVGLNMERSMLFDRINERMDAMLENGLVEEAKQFASYREHNALQTVGYSEVFDYLDGAYDYDELVRLLKRNSRRYAKRQLTWFRKYDDIHWYEPDQKNEIVTFVRTQLEQ